MNFGLRSIRRRQRSLARGVLALFCAAWFQAAVVPCVMAHSAPSAASSAPVADEHQHHGHAAQAGHGHDGADSAGGEAGHGHPCLYCPPDGHGTNSCDDHGGCAFPHDPQVDARAGGAPFAALPVHFVAPSPSAQLLAHRAEVTAPHVVRRVSLAVSYCRFIE